MTSQSPNVCRCSRRDRSSGDDRARCDHCGGWIVEGRLVAPDTVVKLARHTATMLRGVAQNYRWAHGEALSGSATLPSGRNAPGPSDPTGAVACDERREQVRGQVALAAFLLGRSREYALLAAQALVDGFRIADPRPDEHVRSAYHEPQPPTEPSAEIARAKAVAKARSSHRPEDDTWEFG